MGFEVAQCTAGVVLQLVRPQLHSVEAAAAQQRQHVRQHVAAGRHPARVGQAATQQCGLRVGAAIGPLRELQHHAGVAPDLVGAGQHVLRVVQHQRLGGPGCLGVDELHDGGLGQWLEAVSAVLRRTASAACRKGATPMRRAVWMNRSPVTRWSR